MSKKADGSSCNVLSRGVGVNFSRCRMIKERFNSTAGLKKWLKLEDSGDHLSVFATTPRHFPNNRWEPVLIGKSQELPLLDELLLLEGVKVSYSLGRQVEERVL